VPTTTTRITIQTCSSAWLAAIAVGQKGVPKGRGRQRNKGNDRGSRGIREAEMEKEEGDQQQREAQAGMSCREKRQSQRQQHTGQVFEIPLATLHNPP